MKFYICNSLTMDITVLWKYSDEFIDRNTPHAHICYDEKEYIFQSGRAHLFCAAILKKHWWTLADFLRQEPLNDG